MLHELALLSGGPSDRLDDLVCRVRWSGGLNARCLVCTTQVDETHERLKRLLDTYPAAAHRERIQECETYLKNRPNSIHAGAILKMLLELYPMVKRDPVASCKALMQSHRIHQDVQREFYRQHVPAWTHWHLIGPFTAMNLESGMDLALAPERVVDLEWKAVVGADLRLAWQDVPPEKGDAQGWLDLKRWLIDRLPKKKRSEVEAASRFAYAFRMVQAKQQRRALLLYGASERISIWLNGKLVVKQDEPGTHKDARAVDVTLKEGDNEILLKTGASGNKWGFFFRIADPSGCPLPDLPTE